MVTRVSTKATFFLAAERHLPDEELGTWGRWAGAYLALLLSFWDLWIINRMLRCPEAGSHVFHMSIILHSSWTQLGSPKLILCDVFCKVISEVINEGVSAVSEVCHHQLLARREHSRVRFEQMVLAGITNLSRINSQRYRRIQSQQRLKRLAAHPSCICLSSSRCPELWTPSMFPSLFLGRDGSVSSSQCLRAEYLCSLWRLKMNCRMTRQSKTKLSVRNIRWFMRSKKILERELEAACKRGRFGKGGSEVKETETASGVGKWQM